MPISAADAYRELKTRSRELAILNSCAAVLGWDQQTYMPRGGTALRGEQLTWLAGLGHAKATDPKIGEYLSIIETSDLNADKDSIEAANIREWRRGYDRTTKIPARLVEELATLTTAAQQAWDDAKQKSNFATFSPHLEKILKLKREEAQAVATSQTQHLYDALLDEYEPGATATELKRIFDGLVEQLVPFIANVAESGRTPNRTILDRDYPVDRQRLFSEAAGAAIGFDYMSGRLDVTSHPFCSSFGPGDTRITTRFNPRNLESLFGVLHEAGHGMYEQGLPADRFGEPSATFCSMGIHESQSRLWENIVGRSMPFWEYFYPRLKQTFPVSLCDVSLDEFHFAVNDVKPSLIRVDADEATYNLHVALRFELELALIDGSLQINDVPGAWNDGMKKYLGVTVPDDRRGCLQDIHWSFGGIGYFPTYTLGNLYAAQLIQAARRDISDLDSCLSKGDFVPLKLWLNQKIHAHGRRFHAGELCSRVTGKPLSADAFIDELKRKIGKFHFMF